MRDRGEDAVLVQQTNTLFTLKLIESFQLSIERVLTHQYGVGVNSCALSLKNQEELSKSSLRKAETHLRSGKHKIKLSLQIPEESYVNLTERIFESEEPINDFDIELLNVVCGMVRKDLQTIDHSFRRVIPRHIKSDLRSKEPFPSGIEMTLPFRTEYGDLRLQMRIKATK